MATETKADEHRSASSVDFEKEYRLPTESKRQWELRKRFLVQYWEQYDQDRLLSLARS